LGALALLSLPLAAVACGTSDDGENADTGRFAEMANHIKETRELAFDKVLSGTFDRKVRVYGFTFEAKAGAKVNVDIATAAGTDAVGITRGAPLDTIAAVYGPMKGNDKGEKISFVDDGPGAQAQLPAVELKQDGKYLVVLGSWDDPGTDGSYNIKATCRGTDFQCRRPIPQGSCKAGTRYIQGGTVIGTETWNDCEIVLLEEVHVAKDAVLTINPGVTVKGNYIGTGPYGTVSLVVDGTVQAVGTKDYPIVFTALQQGWAGLQVKGNSSTLDNVYVEKAQRGIVTTGSNNTYKNLNVNTGEIGMRFEAGAKDNSVQQVKISQVTSGVFIGQGANASIDDSVILGRANGTGVGVETASSELSQFRRALVAGFGDAMKLDTSALEVYDGTITKNTRGVLISGPQGGVHPPAATTCPNVNNVAPPLPPPSPPPPVTTWRRDPIFVRCDITKNKEYAIKLTAPELLVVEESNVRDNGAGIVVEADTLHQDSRIVRSNIFANGTGAQVEAFHQVGRLNISGNYWAKISDPDLSTSWLMGHTRAARCTYEAGCYDQSCGVPGTWTCTTTQSVYEGNRWITKWFGCSSNSGSVTWSSQFTFTGFSPTELQAGPRPADLCSMVTDERKAQAN
jgi:hypothetical protein